jgi:hypothetical protein
MLRNVDVRFGPALVFLATIVMFLAALAVLFAGVLDTQVNCAALYSC